MAESKSHIAMIPWFAMGHMTPFLHLSNELAQRGFKISFFLPKKAQIQLQNLNLYPNLITFYNIAVPPVVGLPPGVETASEIPLFMNNHLAAAMDLTRPQVEAFIQDMKPDILLYDFAYWVTEIAKPLGIKTICYDVVSAASIAIALVPARKISKETKEEEFKTLPPGYPSSTVVLRPHEARCLMFMKEDFGDGITFYDRSMKAMQECDALSIRTCWELEGTFCEYLGSQFGKTMLLTGPVLPEQAETQLEEKWATWLGGFKEGSVLFCAFGSQYVLEKDQFQELVKGFELTGLPFLIALKPPEGVRTVEEALPEGFAERVKGRGSVCGSWVPQTLILAHKSVGCFVSHCGFGSMWESLMSDCQIVLVPHLGDQILNTRLLADELKVGVEVEREENGWFSKESLRKAIKSVMDEDSEVGDMVKKNHAKWRGVLGGPGFMRGYIDKFVQNLDDLVK